ncbi:MAG TPA: Flp family type IVb pilin [Geomonas sp.]|nr:Flp family type IVb pilin [Geomonas sp.]
MYVKIRSRIDSTLDNEKGATMVEYALMVALIAVVAVAAVTGLGTNVSTKFQSIATAIGG